MGVVYKLKKEITDYILELKRSQPHLSCRSISKIISERFNTTLSKSSVNSVIKKAGLSMPVGRRAKKKYKSRLSQAMPKAEEALTKLLEESPSAKNISEIKKEGAGLPLSDVSSKGMLTAQPISSSPITSEEKQEEKKEERPTEELKPQPPPPNPSPEIKPEEIPIAKEPTEEKELTTAGTPIEVIWLPEENVEDMAELPCKGAIILK
ncbi:MAG: helix-turn-helix domain-containing protein, partial [Candidatus Omnitrophica bacterium]|nr:helix-turn-helix domain-containing protein [Candidatus Omnitrophota bacterium]